MQPNRTICNLLSALVLTCLLASCTVIGPRSINSGRMAYNEAITETDNQQILKAIVHNRYDERGSMLTVSSVTANVSVKTSAGIQAGFGDKSTYDGNLVPFSGGVIYEENPTISYVPVSGERYLRQVTSPIPVAILAQLTGNMFNPGGAFSALVTSANGIYNPDFLLDSQQIDPRFERLITLITELIRSHRLHWVEHPAKNGVFSLVIDQSEAADAAKVRELLELAGISSLGHDGEHIIIPTSLALNGASNGAIGFTTRSIRAMVEIMSASMEVPALDQQNGVAATYPPLGAVGQHLKIHYAQSRPERAYVAVEHRDGWFYIDEQDSITKRYFRLLGSLWSVTMASATGSKHAAPVLTVPVSR